MNIFLTAPLRWFVQIKPRFLYGQRRKVWISSFEQAMTAETDLVAPRQRLNVPKRETCKSSTKAVPAILSRHPVHHGDNLQNCWHLAIAIIIKNKYCSSIFLLGARTNLLPKLSLRIMNKLQQATNALHIVENHMKITTFELRGDLSPLSFLATPLLVLCTAFTLSACGKGSLPTPSHTVEADLAQIISVQSCRVSNVLVYCTISNRTSKAIDLSLMDVTVDCYNKAGTKIGYSKRGGVVDPNGTAEVQTCLFIDHIPGRLNFSYGKFRRE